MERRKFVLGLGSLAAGGAAAMGTGAFTRSEVDRDMTGRVKADNGDAYVGIQASGGPNDFIVAETNSVSDGTSNDGVVGLDFNGNGAGKGLNYDSVNWFDNVFELVNRGTQPVKFYIRDNTDAQLSPNVFQFYRHSDPSVSVEGSNNAVSKNVGSALNVGIKVDLRNWDIDTEKGGGANLASQLGYDKDGAFTVIADAEL